MLVIDSYKIQKTKTLDFYKLLTYKVKMKKKMFIIIFKFHPSFKRHIDIDSCL